MICANQRLNIAQINAIHKYPVTLGATHFYLLP